MKSGSLTKEFFCFTTKTGITGITMRTEYGKRRMQENYATGKAGCRRKWGERNGIYKTVRGLK
jgi:hypothetical protein